MHTDGYTLKYKGEKYSPDGRINNISVPNALKPTASLSKTNQFAHIYSSFGSLAIRYQQELSQLAGLLQQTSFSPEGYNMCPVQQANRGSDQQNPITRVCSHHNLQDFGHHPGISTAKNDTLALLELSHGTFGKGKLLNERTQPQKTPNRNIINGEITIFEAIHNILWGAGRSLAFKLNEARFEYQETETGRKIPLQQLSFAIDMNNQVTSQSNCILVSSTHSDGKNRPIGTIIKDDKPLPAELTENIIRTLIVAKGGYHKLTPQQQEKLFQGAFKVTREARSSENIAFNAIYSYMPQLEALGFDPRVLVSKEKIHMITEQLQKAFRAEGAIDNYLVGSILTEMIQPLFIHPNNLPPHYQIPHIVSQNTAKAIPFAFSITKSDGTSLVQPLQGKASVTVIQDSTFDDVKIEGRLIDPELTHGKHIAAILATAMLVAEQLIIETLIADALTKHKAGHKNTSVAYNILSHERAIGITNIDELLAIAHKIPAEKLGRQHPECDELVAALRTSLGWDKLIPFVKEIKDKQFPAPSCFNNLTSLFTGGNSPSKEVAEILVGLWKIGEQLDEYPSTSAAKTGSVGINAGVYPVLKKLIPNIVQAKDITPPFRKESVASGKKQAAITPQHNTPLKSHTHQLQQRNYSSSFSDLRSLQQSSASSLRNSLSGLPVLTIGL